MKIYEEKEVTVIREHLHLMTCDLCGKSTQGEDWTRKNYDVSETEVSCRVGTNYGSSSTGTTYEVDICPDCFINVLIPWVEARAGRKIPGKDWSW